MNMILRDHFFDSFFNNFGKFERDISHYDIIENEESFNIQIELAGIRKEHLSIKVHENHLIIKADNKKANEKVDGDYRVHKRYEKSFKLHSDIDQEKISCELENGILSINLPKFEKKQPKEIKVEVK